MFQVMAPPKNVEKITELMSGASNVNANVDPIFRSLMHQEHYDYNVKDRKFISENSLLMPRTPCLQTGNSLVQ